MQHPSPREPGTDVQIVRQKKAPAPRQDAGATFSPPLLPRNPIERYVHRNKFRISILKRQPLASASLSDIRDGTIVLTGSLSLVATALFGGSDRLMTFLQAKIPATSTAIDNRYRQWVFALSKIEPLRIAQRVAVEYAEDGTTTLPLVFPQRIPSWRSHWRGDRAYLMPLSFLPPLLAALSAADDFLVIKDPSLRFDARIPWEVAVGRGGSLRVVWRDAHAQTSRTIELQCESDTWHIVRDEIAGRAAEPHAEAGPLSLLGHFFPNEDRIASFERRRNA